MEREELIKLVDDAILCCDKLEEKLSSSEENIKNGTLEEGKKVIEDIMDNLQRLVEMMK